MTGDLHHLSAAYALDAVDADERRAFEAHYPSCEVCTADLRNYRSVAASLAATAVTPPPAAMKAAVMSEVSQTRQLPPLSANPVPARQPTRARLLAVAAGLVLVAGASLALFLAAQSDGVDEVVSAPDAIVTTLTGTTPDQIGTLQVVWSDLRDEVVVVGSDLADPGADKVYALWVLQDGGAVAGGLFSSESGSVSQAIEIQDDDAIGWGITIEPAGGSPQPSTPVLFAGTL